MRLTAIAVRNYRVLRDLRVTLDPARTVIGAPNESGKSTLVEAAHRALFLRFKTTGEAQKEMVSKTHGGHPEVEVEFEARGQSWRVLKRFSGATGTATLTETGGKTWNGEEAEARLAELLGVEAASGGRGAGDRAAQQWGHLWVWQGGAGDNPAPHANAQREALLSRLHTTGGAAAMQSALDGKVAAAIADRRDAIYKQNDTPKAGSALAQAQEEERRTGIALESARQAAARLEQAVTSFRDAERAIQSSTDCLAVLEPQEAEIREKLARVAALQAEEKLQATQAERVSEQHQTLAAADQSIRDLRADIHRRTETLTPLELAWQRSTAEEAECRQRDAEAEHSFTEVCARVRVARLRSELAGAHRQRLERTVQRDQLRARLENVAAARAELVDLETKLARTPPVTPDFLKKLRKLEQERSTAEAALNAMAAGLEVITGTVAVQGQTLDPGGRVIITEDTEVTAAGARLRVRPGGGTSLAAARGKVQDARAKVRRALDEHGLATFADAERAAEQRQQIESELKSQRASLAGMGDATIDAECAASQQAVTEAEAEVARRSTTVEDFTPPADLAAAHALAADLARQLHAAESGETAARAAREAAARSLKECAARLAEKREALAEEKHALDDCKAQLRLLIQTHRDDADRTAALAALAEAKSAAAGLLSRTRDALKALQPELLAGDLKRLERALEEQKHQRAEAEKRHAVARNELRREGTSDPQADLAMAEAAALSATERREAEERKARAILLLHQLFRDEQQALSDQYTRPLAERISGYLECLYGPGARAVVRMEDHEFKSLELVRPDQAAGAFPFDSLSGGAREQLAAAVRLAMAEVLAESHDGCLPLVFDDAFAYADPARVQRLQRMLDLAAARGLQIIVLTCDPADYTALGAKLITMDGKVPGTLSRR